LSGPGPTTRQFVDSNNNPVNSVGGQNANNDFVAGSTAFDVSGNPIVVALDSSVQSLTTGISTSNTALASIQSSATALVRRAPKGATTRRAPSRVKAAGPIYAISSVASTPLSYVEG
jgi:hypothetical protein